MNWLTLEKVWNRAGQKSQVKVRFCDWTQNIKYFVIMGESSDGRRFVGILDNGEKISFSKKSKGWDFYYEDAEWMPHAV